MVLRWNFFAETHCSERNHHCGLLNNTWICLELYMYLCKISSQSNNTVLSPVFIVEAKEKKCRWQKKVKVLFWPTRVDMFEL